MSRFANDYDIALFLRTFDDGSTPNLYHGASVLEGLADWADQHSDGWEYWPKPLQAAQRLIGLLEDARAAWRTGGLLMDVSKRDLNAALRPIKSFLTREGDSFDLVFGSPVMIIDCSVRPAEILASRRSKDSNWSSRPTTACGSAPALGV